MGWGFCGWRLRVGLCLGGLAPAPMTNDTNQVQARVYTAFKTGR